MLLWTGRSTWSTHKQNNRRNRHTKDTIITKSYQMAKVSHISGLLQFSKMSTKTPFRTLVFRILFFTERDGLNQENITGIIILWTFFELILYIPSSRSLLLSVVYTPFFLNRSSFSDVVCILWIFLSQTNMRSLPLMSCLMSNWAHMPARKLPFVPVTPQLHTPWLQR